MIKRLLFVLALLSVLRGAQAQKQRFVELGTQVYNKAYLSGRITEVIDARPDRTGIGWVQTGLANERTPANFRQDLAPTLQRLLQTAPASTTTATYALRVHRLEIGEITTAGSETASAELVADLLRPRPDGQYELLWRAAEATTSRGLEVTGQHPANIAAVLRSCLTQFEAANPASLPALAVLTGAQAAEPEATLRTLVPYPLLTEPVRRAGVYESFDEFRRNAPGGKRLAVLSKTPRARGKWAGIDEVEVFYLDQQGQRFPVRNVWGYCDGQDVYILYQRRFYHMTMSEEGGTFLAPSAPDNDAVLAGAVLGGAIGGAVAGAASGGLPQEHKLSLLTGRVVAVPLSETNAAFGDEMPSTEARVVVYARKAVPAGTELYAAGKAVDPLDARTAVVTVPWTNKREALQLCLRTNGAAEQCVQVLPRAGETVYFEYAEGGRLKQVAAKEGAFEARRAARRVQQVWPEPEQ